MLAKEVRCLGSTGVLQDAISDRCNNASLVVDANDFEGAPQTFLPQSNGRQPTLVPWSRESDSYFPEPAVSKLYFFQSDVADPFVSEKVGHIFLCQFCSLFYIHSKTPCFS